MANSGRVFSEQEVAALVKRAIELQDQTKDAPDYTPGVTEDELRRIANELGVDPKFLEQAIAEGPAPESRRGPLHLTEEHERVVDVELKPEDFDMFLGELRSVNSRGSITQIGRTLKGMTWTGWGAASVEISSRRGRTKVRVKSNPLMAWLFTLHPAFILSVIALPIMGAKGLILPAIGLAAGLWITAFAGFKWVLAKGHEAGRRLVDKLVGMVREEGSDVREPVSKTSPPVEAETEVQTQRT